MRFLALLPLFACVNAADPFRPDITDAPSIYHIGELDPVLPEEVAGVVADPETYAANVHYGQLGADPDPGVLGGATFDFAGTGGTVCVIIDPEAVYWNRTEEEGDTVGKIKYTDIYEDDGDLDVNVGLTAYYTGSPGVEMGDFNAIYTDPAGVDHTLAFNECVQTNQSGISGIHAGRATVEYCEIDTAARAGVMFTGAIETFSLPIDDSVLNFGVMVVDGDCNELYAVVGEDQKVVSGPSECILPDEVHKGGGEQEGKDWFAELEADFCVGPARLNSFCAEHLGEDDPPCLPIE